MPDIEAQIKVTQKAVDAAEIQLQKNAQGEPEINLQIISITIYNQIYSIC